MSITDFFTQTIGIDPGTHYLRLLKEKRITFNEKTEISIDPLHGKITGYGNQSIHDEQNIVVNPINRVISDFDAYEELVREAIKRSSKKKLSYFEGIKMFISIPTTASEIDKRAYRDSAEHTRAKEVYLIHDACSQAIGMDILFSKKDFILIDISASKVEITIFSDCFPIEQGYIQLGTIRLKKGLKNHFRREYKISKSEKELDQLLNSLYLIDNAENSNSLTKSIIESREVIQPYLIIIKEQLLESIENTIGHPNFDKIIKNGIFFTGGGSLIPWLTNELQVDSKIKTNALHDPLLDNIKGLNIIMNSTDKFNHYIMS